MRRNDAIVAVAVRGMVRAAASFGALVAASAAVGAPAFEQPVELRGGTDPTAVCVADFNGDGKPDIAIANNGSDDVSIFWQDSGGGTYTLKQTVGAGDGPVRIVQGLLNEDAHVDLAVANNKGCSVSILLNKGDGTFEESSIVPVTGSPTGLAVGKFGEACGMDWKNPDFGPKCDLVVGTTRPDGFVVLRNLGGASYVTQSWSDLDEGSGVSDVDAGDVDDDKDVDIVVTMRGDRGVGQMAIYENTGVLNGAQTGVWSFTPWIRVSLVGASGPLRPTNTTVCDVNGDYVIDFVLACPEAEVVAAFMSHWSSSPGTGGGPKRLAGLSRTWSQRAPEGPGAVAWAEFGPGPVQFVTANPAGKSLSIVGNSSATGGGGVADRPLLRIDLSIKDAGNVRDVVVADLNGDNKADLVSPLCFLLQK